MLQRITGAAIAELILPRRPSKKKHQDQENTLETILSWYKDVGDGDDDAAADDDDDDDADAPRIPGVFPHDLAQLAKELESMCGQLTPEEEQMVCIG